MTKFEVFLYIFSAVAITALITLEILAQRKKDGLTPESAKEIALSVISRVALASVTDAERQYGAGTGELKMSACLAKLIELLPEAVVELVPKDELQKALEKALVLAKEKWLKNPRLLE